MGRSHIIELNGQRYDALTGAIVTSSPVPASKVSKPKLAGGQSMDGFARAGKHSLKPHQAEKSKTLMRKTVSRPVHQPAASSPRLVPSPSVIGSHAGKHGKAVPKSPLVSRFGAPGVTAPVMASATKAPALATQTHHTSHPTQMSDPVSTGLAQATSHQQPKIKKARLHKRVAHKLHISPRLVSMGSFVLAFLLIGGFFAYQNIPGLTMRMAAARSGVQGSLPGYQPAGFGLAGGISYHPGQIAINYKSNSDQRNFKVTQENSTWDSTSLLDNYVAINNRGYQTVQEKGKTVYIYDDSNATWVDGGIWYRIEGDSSLNSDQLLHIAASL